MARVLIAIVAATLLFTWWSNNTGRGFLQQYRGCIWIDGHESSDGWQWSIMEVTKGDSFDVAAPEPPDVLRICIAESSMGRTDLGLWSSWRASHWFVNAVADTNGWQFWNDRSDLHKEAMTESLHRYIRDSIIPNSAALGIWEEVVPDAVDRDGDSWSAHQRKFSVIALVVTLLMCIGAGILIAIVIVPIRRMSVEGRYA